MPKQATEHPRFVTLYHLYKVYDAIKVIKFALGHLEGDYVADDIVVTKRFQGLVSALGRVDVGYLEGYIEDEISHILRSPPSVNEAALTVYLRSWAKQQGFGMESAEEIAARQELTPEQRRWIEDFISQWRRTVCPASVST